MIKRVDKISTKDASFDHGGSSSRRRNEDKQDNLNEKEIYSNNDKSVNLEEEPKEEINQDKIKINMPFNNKILMIIISFINLLSGVSATYYAFTVLYYMNNPNAYKRHLFISFNYSTATLIEKVEKMNASKLDYYSITNNYLIFGILQLICSFFAFLIRVPRFNWKKDILPYVCYEGLANISCLGNLVLWFLMMKIDFIDLSGTEIFFKFFALILSITSFCFKLLTSKWSFNDYFDVINIEDLILK